MCLGVPDCQPEAGRFIDTCMNDAEKQARRAEALRANLRKRKAQARAQAAEAEPQRDCTQSAAASPK